MKFLKLLDPYELTDNDPSAAGRQQQRVAELFPKLVTKSRLHYWRPGDAIVADGVRLLIGLAASYDLKDLRLADIINDTQEWKPNLHIDVFNVEDCNDIKDVPEYFPGIALDYYVTPIVGIWEKGVL